MSFGIPKIQHILHILVEHKPFISEEWKSSATLK